MDRLVVQESREPAPLRHIPDEDRVVVRGRGQQAEVGTEGDRVHIVQMTLKEVGALPSRRIPQGNDAIGTGGSQHTVSTERDLVDDPVVPMQRLPYGLEGMRIPETDRTVLSAGGDPLPVRAKTNAMVKSLRRMLPEGQLLSPPLAVDDEVSGSVDSRPDLTVVAHSETDQGGRLGGDRLRQPAAAGHVPEDDMTIPPSRDQPPAVRAEGERVDLPDVGVQHLGRARRFAQVPKPDRGIGAGGGQLAPIRAEGDREDVAGVTWCILKFPQCKAKLPVAHRIP